MAKRNKKDPKFISNGDRLAAATAEIEGAIRDNLSPEAVATIVAFLQPAAFYKPANEDARKALQEIEWFADTLTAMLGVEEHNRLMEELGL